ncbi:hypothetical protein [Bradyrhizobium sp. CB1015]|uniref:acyltransferase n=1 Tax=Bradyrhizobium sp. CB1015 TaxID=2976822 RepID=UPI0021A9F7D3|nr:hypothetical protein [Bradyrhizobium sp. CB1015]UWU91389.1 hypothetical protein N2604_33920 [Bradyrhizobium sp. CB1015]
MSILLQIVGWLLPWYLRRQVLIRLLGYEISPSARIGFSIVVADKVAIDSDSRIGHATLIKNLSEFRLGKNAIIGNFNIISGCHGTQLYPYSEQNCVFVMEDGAAITHEHRVDCANKVTIGAFTTIAGRGSQIWTHGIDPRESKQLTAEVRVGRYVLVSTRVTILKGSILEDNSIVAAGAVVNGVVKSLTLVAGMPARSIRNLTGTEKYFLRTTPVVD